MIVEDDIYDYESAYKKLSYLNSVGEIIHLTNGQQAIDYLFQTGKYNYPEGFILPDLMLLDIRMPKVNGIELLKKIRDEAADEIKNIPVIIFTSNGDLSNNKQCFELGAKGYLEKPIQLNHLKDMLITLNLVA